MVRLCFLATVFHWLYTGVLWYDSKTLIIHYGFDGTTLLSSCMCLHKFPVIRLQNAHNSIGVWWYDSALLIFPRFYISLPWYGSKKTLFVLMVRLCYLCISLVLHLCAVMWLQNAYNSQSFWWYDYAFLLLYFIGFTQVCCDTTPKRL